MEPETRRVAVEKATRLTYKIGHPEWLFNPTRMARDWGNVRFECFYNVRS